MAFCFLEISIGEIVQQERIIIQLYTDVAPLTCANFLSLCHGTQDQISPISFTGSTFHRVIKNFMIQGGDFERGDGTGGRSIYGPSFADENFVLKHSGPGILSMANSGKDTNGSQFFILTAAAQHLDNKHVVFGKVIQGMNTVRRIENTQKDASDCPILKVMIKASGELTSAEALTPQVNSSNDPLPDYPEDFTHDESDPPKLLEAAAQIKACGVELFKRGLFAEALEKFDKSVRYLRVLDPSPELLVEATAEQKKLYFSVLVSCGLNAAMCALKINAFEIAVTNATRVLELQLHLTKHNMPSLTPMERSKCFYRRAQGQSGLKNMIEATNDFRLALKETPDDALAKKALSDTEKKMKAVVAAEKAMYAKMFQ